MQNIKTRAAVAATLVMGAVTSAHAALPTALDTAFETFQADATSLLEKGWPLLLSVFGGMVLMKLFKKIGNKAT